MLFFAGIEAEISDQPSQMFLIGSVSHKIRLRSLAPGGYLRERANDSVLDSGAADSFLFRF